MGQEAIVLPRPRKCSSAAQRHSYATAIASLEAVDKKVEVLAAQVPRGPLHSIPKQCPITTERAFIPLFTQPQGRGSSINMLFDSGAQASILTETDLALLRRERVPYSVIEDGGIKLSAADGANMPVSKVVVLTLFTITSSVRVPFFVCPGATTSILGINAILTFDLVLDPAQLTVDPQAEITVSEIASDGQPLYARALERKLIQGRQGKGVRCEIATEKGKSVRRSSKGFPIAAAVDFGYSASIIKANENGEFTVPVSNMERAERVIEIGELIAQVSDLKDFQYINKTEVTKQAVEAEQPIKKHTPQERKDVITMLTKSVKASVPYQYQQSVLNLLKEYEDVFSANKNDIGFCPVLEHTINLKHKRPVFRPQYKLPDDHFQAIKDQTLAWMKAGIVKRCQSNYNNPIFAVPKPHNRGIRVVLDFRKLNDATLADKYCVPSVDDTLQRIGQAGAEWFSSIDLSSGFYHIPLRESDQHLTAYTLPGLGSFAWSRAAMGLTGSPASFNRVLDAILSQVDNCINYVDDILCFTKNPRDHLQTLRQVLEKLRKAGLRANPEKSIFLTKSLDYLGAEISADSITYSKDKATKIAAMSPPDSMRQLQKTLGMFNYGSKFIFHYAKKVYPLQQLVRSQASWSGGPLPPRALFAFHRIRAELAARPKLGYILPHRALHLYIDASMTESKQDGKGFGAVLLQDTPGEVRRPVAYLSRSLRRHELNYPAGLAEIKAATWAIRRLEPHLKARKTFALYCQHRDLLNRMRDLNAHHRKTLAHCHDTLDNYLVVWKPLPYAGVAIADFLSHYHGVPVGEPKRPGEKGIREMAANAALVSHVACNPLGIDDSEPRIRWLQSHDEECINIMTEIAGTTKDSTVEDPIEVKSQFVKQKVTMFSGVLMIKPGTGNGSGLSPRRFSIFAPWAKRKELLLQAHRGGSPGLTGHFGTGKTTSRISRCFWWPGLTRDVKEFVKQCHTCNVSTRKNKPPPVPRRPIPAPRQPGELVQMDLMGPVRTRKYPKAFLLVIVDALTRYMVVKAIPNKEPSQVALQLLDYASNLGTPKRILTDNGREFRNQVEEELARLLNIHRSTTSNYHPQCNGLVENMNKTVQEAIRKAMTEAKKDNRYFEEYLPSLQFDYNTNVHEVTQIAPFEAMFGYPARHSLWPDFSGILEPADNPLLSPMDRIGRHVQHVRDIQQLAKSRTDEFRETQKERFNEKVGARSPNYEPRCPVLVRRFKPETANAKFETLYREAFVIKQPHLNSYVIFVPEGGRGGNGLTQTVAANSLKPAVHGTPWMDAATFRRIRAHVYDNQVASDIGMSSDSDSERGGPSETSDDHSDATEHETSDVDDPVGDFGYGTDSIPLVANQDGHTASNSGRRRSPQRSPSVHAITRTDDSRREGKDGVNSFFRSHLPESTDRDRIRGLPRDTVSPSASSRRRTPQKLTSSVSSNTRPRQHVRKPPASAHPTWRMLPRHDNGENGRARYPETRQMDPGQGWKPNNQRRRSRTGPVHHRGPDDHDDARILEAANVTYP